MGPKAEKRRRALERLRGMMPDMNDDGREDGLRARAVMIQLRERAALMHTADGRRLPSYDGTIRS